MISLQAIGLIRLAAPICTAVAPAIIISMTSSALEIPPIPMIGRFVASYTSYTILNATGKIAGPEKPPFLLAMTGFLRLISMRIPIKVLISEIPSAPPSSAARAISLISVTFGLSFI